MKLASVRKAEERRGEMIVLLEDAVSATWVGCRDAHDLAVRLTDEIDFDKVNEILNSPVRLSD